jgi:hypothetical protein
MGDDNGNVHGFPLGPGDFQRHLVEIAKHFIATLPRPPKLNPERELFDRTVMTLLSMGMPPERALEQAKAVIEARREMFPRKSKRDRFVGAEPGKDHRPSVQALVDEQDKPSC